MTYFWQNPKNPPKKWWDDCVSGVKESGSAYDPQSVCGALWYKKMSPTQKRAATRKAENPSDAIALHFDVVTNVQPPLIEVFASGPAIANRSKGKFSKDTLVVLGHLEPDGRFFNEFASYLDIPEEWIIERVPEHLKTAAWGR